MKIPQKILLVYPETPATFWSYHNALSFISKKAAEPPLGLITVAALLPKDWEVKLIDTNVSTLRDDDIRWSDYVFVGGMSIHQSSFESIVSRIKKLGRKVIAGGPMATMIHEDLVDVDHFVLNEAEITLPLFLEDLKKNRAKKIYTSEKYCDITETPPPRWDLLNMKKYANVDIQYSRGCPFNCDFCAITSLYGHKPRTKDTAQFIGELDTLYQAGWRSNVFVVDDNFIGNKKKLKTDFLPALIDWCKKRDYPFSFYTEVSVNLSDDGELMQLMVQAGFEKVFVGIETPVEDGLVECGKVQNRNRDLLESVNIMQRAGLEVLAGFIVGFDTDKSDIFDRQINFIQKSGIITAMVGLLNAQVGTSLFSRLRKERRLITGFTGDNTDGTLNFSPRMHPEALIAGYKRIVQTIFSHNNYFERIKTFLKVYNPPATSARRVTFSGLRALCRAIWRLGIIDSGRRFFWKLLGYVIIKCRKNFPLAVRTAIHGFHFRKIAEAL